MAINPIHIENRRLFHRFGAQVFSLLCSGQVFSYHFMGTFIKQQLFSQPLQRLSSYCNYEHV